MVGDEVIVLLFRHYDTDTPPRSAPRSAVSVRSIRHSTWKILRTVKRSPVPPTGRELRLTLAPRTRNGSFLTALIDEGLLRRVTGTAEEPFEATYDLTDLWIHSAEYGE